MADEAEKMTIVVADTSTLTAGLLGAPVPQLAMPEEITRARLNEIERRILTIEERLNGWGL